MTAPTQAAPTQAALERAYRIVQLLDELREPEGNSVTLYCNNPEFNHQPDCIVEVAADWADGWSPQRFGGDNLLLALEAAANEYRYHKRKRAQTP